MNRKQFLKTLGAGMASACLPVSPLMAIDPIKRTDQPFLKISLNVYSFNRPLRAGEMTLDDVLEFCATHQFQAIDPTGYYFPHYPDAPPSIYINEFKRKAFTLGLDISGTGVRNDFTRPDKGARTADVDLIKEWIQVAAKLGAPALRVFAGRGVPEGYQREEVVDWVAEHLQGCADYGEKLGVMIALQNHADFLKTSEQILTLLNKIQSPWFAMNLDIGSFPTSDPYKDIERIVPYAVTWQIKEQVSVNDRKVDTDFERVIEIIRNAGYRGYLPIETLGEGDPKIKIPRLLAQVRKAMQS